MFGVLNLTITPCIYITRIYIFSVSIARRLQDPLSEYVKIDPQSIGVGMYQAS